MSTRPALQQVPESEQSQGHYSDNSDYNKRRNPPVGDPSNDKNMHAH